MRKLSSSLFYSALISTIFTFCVFGEGFITGTLVKTPDGYMPIESIEVNDSVICCDDDGNIVTSIVLAKQKKIAPSPVIVTTKTSVIIADHHQLFYTLPHQKWIEACMLTTEHFLLSPTRELLAITSTHQTIIPGITHSLSVKDHHNFFISKDDILVHNMIFVAVPIAAPAAGATLAAAAEITTAVTFFAGLMYSIFKHSPDTTNKTTSSPSRHKNNNDDPCPCGHLCGIGCNCGCSCGCGQKEWKKNKITKQEFFKRKEISENYEHVRNGIYRLRKSGKPIVKDAYYLQWDHLR